MGEPMGTVEELRKIMKENEKFDEYVRAYCRSRGKSINQALRDKMVQEVAEFYKE